MDRISSLATNQSMPTPALDIVRALERYYGQPLHVDFIARELRLERSDIDEVLSQLQEKRIIQIGQDKWVTLSPAEGR